MTKKFIFLWVLFSVSMFSCKNENTVQAVENAPPTAPAPGGNAAIEKIKAGALDESDYLGRVRNSFVPVQEELTNAEGKIPSIGKVSLFVDDHYMLLIKNEKGRDVFETKVDLRNLNPNDGGMMLVPDQHPGEFPGIKIFALDGKPGVQYLKNGKLEKEERFLEIYLPQRGNIERIAPALSQALMIAHQKI